jgi:nitroreductase
VGLALDPDALLTTTRSVRRRLDVERPVEREVLEECLAIAQQAPTGGNAQAWAFVVVTDADKRAALADLYRRGWDAYRSRPSWSASRRYDDPARQRLQRRITGSAKHLADTLQDVPVHVVPCMRFRPEGAPSVALASHYGSIYPAVWSLILAARTRGLGATITTLHLFHEREAAEVLGIPYDEVAQAGLVPIAYSKGTDFRPAPREPLERFVHWEGWDG